MSDFLELNWSPELPPSPPPNPKSPSPPKDLCEKVEQPKMERLVPTPPPFPPWRSIQQPKLEQSQLEASIKQDLADKSQRLDHQSQELLVIAVQQSLKQGELEAKRQKLSVQSEELDAAAANIQNMKLQLMQKEDALRQREAQQQRYQENLQQADNQGWQDGSSWQGGASSSDGNWRCFERSGYSRLLTL